MTPESIDSLMESYCRNHIRRVYFIPTDSVDDTFWRKPNPPYNPHYGENFERPRLAIGEFLPAFSRAAKAHGMEFVAVYKPFDAAFSYASAPGSEEARQFDRLRCLSGVMTWTSQFIPAHPTLRMRRRPGDLARIAEQGSASRIIVTTEGNPGQGTLLLWGSGDNGEYRVLSRRGLHPGVRRVEFEVPTGGEERYFALTAEGCTRPFGNSLQRLVQCYDAEGRELLISFAVSTSDKRSDGSSFCSGFFRSTFCFDQNLTGPLITSDHASY